MALGKLSPLQERVLIALAGLQPPWTLTGGGALAGFHTKHRETRDLDMFFHGQRTLGETVTDATVGDATILVETPHQLLVNKLNALLSRSELRDLVDVRALLASGEDLSRALGDCPGQDAGFSPLTFSWATRSLPVSKLAKALDWSDADADELERFRDGLVDEVLARARPE